MKLTKNLKLVILKQFKAGEELAYLADLYEVSPGFIEALLRGTLIEQDAKLETRREP